MKSRLIDEVELTYVQLLEAWNDRNAQRMADLFARNGELIGFDGSHEIGRENIYSHLCPIFRDHPTARYIAKIKHVIFLGRSYAMLRAIAGMISPGEADINPMVNTHHTMILIKQDENWHILLFQNTPALFHGRPELVEQMTEELRNSIVDFK